MKKKFSKILGVGLTLALLTSLLLTAAPVSAVTVPVVTLTEKDVNNPAYEISKENVYTVLFTTGVKVPANGEIVVGFEAGHNITGMTEANVKIQSTAGLGGVEIDNGATPPLPVAVFDAVATGTYPAAQTLTITPSASLIIGSGAIVELTIGGAGVFVTNPNTAGSYNLTVATQTGAATPVVIEAAVTSAAYTIIVPVIPGLAGVASVYNPTGVLMTQTHDLEAAVDAAGVDYTIHVTRGTYTVSGTLNLDVSGLTFVATEGAALTIIDADGVTGIIIEIAVAATGVTVDGFTIEDDDGDPGIWIRGDDAIIQNNIVTYTTVFGTGIDISSEATGATVSGNTLNENAAIILHGSGSTVSGNTFGDIMNFWALGVLEDVTITDNNFVSVAAETAKFGILLRGGAGATTIDDTLIEGNTIDGRANGGILIGYDSTGGLTVTDLKITGNDITNHGSDTGDLDDSGIIIHADTVWGAGNVIKYNTITGNEDYGIVNNDTLVDIDATFNWWGTTVAADIAAMVTGATKTVTTAPFLVGVADTVFSATAAGTGTALDGSADVGVAVSGAPTDSNIAVAKYIANPQEAIAGAIAFYDVYVAGGTGTADVTIKFYAGDALTEVYLWSAGTQIWSGPLPDVAFSAYGGYVYVDVDPAVLGGTPFALVAGPGAALTTPVITIPVIGAEDVSLRPTLVWEVVAVADAYDAWLADNPDFTDATTERVTTTFWATPEDLQYDTTYWWRVRAVTLLPLALGDWSESVFITMAEPVEPTPPVVVEEAPPAPEIIIEQPDLIVTVPAATPITPAWIYVIIAVGAVLVIALLVLIVRTRRVA